MNRAFDISDRNIAVVDIGGGSTEIVLASAGHIEKIYSTSLGAVRLNELYGNRSNLFGEDVELLVREVDRQLKRDVKKRAFVPQVVYGTGGTFTALASMIIASRNEDSQLVWGYRVTRADVRHLLDRLSNMSNKERRSLPGLNQDRADIIVAGLAIVDRVMSRLQTNILRIHTGGVRDGLLLTMIDELPQPSNTPRVDRWQRSSHLPLAVGRISPMRDASPNCPVQYWISCGMSRSFTTLTATH